VLAYGTYITNPTYVPDDYLSLLAKVDHVASGTWFAGFIYNCLLQANYRMAAALFALVYLIAIAVLLWARKGKGGILLSILLYYLAFSTYQAVLGFTISVIMIHILITGLVISADFSFPAC